MELRLVAISIMCGRVGYVVFEGDKLIDWGMTTKASKSVEDLVEYVDLWTRRYDPSALVSEEISPATKKMGKTLDLFAGLNAAMEQRAVLHVRVVRERPHRNRFIEAACLVEEFPELEPWLPVQENFYDPEPRSVVLFEALALGNQVRRAPAMYLAQAMG